MNLLLSVFKPVALNIWGDHESLHKFVKAKDSYFGKPDILCIQFRAAGVCLHWKTEVPAGRLCQDPAIQKQGRRDQSPHVLSL